MAQASLNLKTDFSTQDAYGINQTRSHLSAMETGERYVH